MGIQQEDIQKEHFNKIILQYEAHYDGKYSQKYRNKFINKYLFANINLENKYILEAMAGSGQTTNYLLSKKGLVFGNDISDKAIERYKERWPNTTAICSSILNTGFKNDFFDIIVIVGGLHHLFPKVDEAIDEVYRILKPGGFFCFFEPHKASIPNKIRVFWYKYDKFFEPNEQAIDLKKLKIKFSPKFDFIYEKFGGNLAYLLVLNSLILRVPIFFKNIISPILLYIESFINIFQNKFLTCFVISQWKKK
jgi:SAM-dependent methyltransferase